MFFLKDIKRGQYIFAVCSAGVPKSPKKLVDGDFRVCVPSETLA